MGLEILFRPNAMKSMQKAIAQCQKGALKQAEVLTRDLSGGRVARTVTMPIEDGHRTFIQIVDKNGREICHKTKDTVKQTIFSEDLQNLFPNIRKFTFRKSNLVDMFAPGDKWQEIADLRTSLSGDGNFLGSLMPRGNIAAYWKADANYIKQNATPDKINEAYRYVRDVVSRSKAVWDNISVIKR